MKWNENWIKSFSRSFFHLLAPPLHTYVDVYKVFGIVNKRLSAYCVAFRLYARWLIHHTYIHARTHAHTTGYLFLLRQCRGWNVIFHFFNAEKYDSKLGVCLHLSLASSFHSATRSHCFHKLNININVWTNILTSFYRFIFFFRFSYGFNIWWRPSKMRCEIGATKNMKNSREFLWLFIMNDRFIASNCQRKKMNLFKWKRSNNNSKFRWLFQWNDVHRRILVSFIYIWYNWFLWSIFISRNFGIRLMDFGSTISFNDIEYFISKYARIFNSQY